MSVGMKEVKINFETRMLLPKMEKDICGCKEAKLQQIIWIEVKRVVDAKNLLIIIHTFIYSHVFSNL